MPVLRIGHYPEPTPILPTEIDTHKCRYVRLLSNHLAKCGESEHVRRTGVERILIDHLHQARAALPNPPRTEGTSRGIMD